MFRLAVLVSFVLLSIYLVPTAVTETSSATPIPSLIEYIQGETNGTRQQFSVQRILLPQVPINVTIQFHNNDTMDHTFTIDDQNNTVPIGKGVISTELVAGGQNATVAFTILSMAPLIQISYNNTIFAPEKSPNGGILYYCIPHRGTATLGTSMVGEIVLASIGTTTGTPEKGILIRAYWIGIIGIAATLAWTIISYFIIKSSSGHFKDHHEHVRKGLP